MTRYFFVVLLMGLVGIAIVVKGAMIMFAERQYWHDVADRFVKENVTVKPNRGNILSSDGKLMASSLPEYKIYGLHVRRKDEKRRKRTSSARILSGKPISIPSVSGFIRFFRTSVPPPSKAICARGGR